MKIVLTLAALLAAFLVIVAFQPADFHVTRSTRIAAPASVIFSQINDLRQWETWSPWEKLDPQLKRSFSGAQSGLGASYAWVGNSKVGEGRMEITESRPAERVRLRLEFLKPMAATNSAEFTLVPDGDQTKVTWTMSGRKNFICKAVTLFIGMDKMLGGEFEKGLAAMKANTEAMAAPSATVARR